MNENDQNQHLQEVNDHITSQHEHRPYWRRVHHSWIFWVFVILMLFSITYYIMSVDFAFAPRVNNSTITK